MLVTSHFLKNGNDFQRSQNNVAFHPHTPLANSSTGNMDVFNKQPNIKFGMKPLWEQLFNEREGIMQQVRANVEQAQQCRRQLVVPNLSIDKKNALERELRALSQEYVSLMKAYGDLTRKINIL